VVSTQSTTRYEQNFFFFFFFFFKMMQINLATGDNPPEN
jgi:hypothetical protein